MDVLVTLLQWLDATLYDGLPFALVTLGLVVTLKYARFPDVTISGTFVLGAAVSAHAVVTLGSPVAIAILVAALAGALGGLLTALFHVALRIERLLSSILAAFAIYSLNLLLLRPTLPYGEAATLLTGPERIDRAIGWHGLAWHPASIAILAILVSFAAGALHLFLRTEKGLLIRCLEDEDSGELLLMRLGFSPGQVKSLALCVGNAFASIGGAVTSMKEGAANAHRGFDVLLTGLVAFLLGEQLWQGARRIGAAVRTRLSPGASRVGSSSALGAAILGALGYYALIGLAQRLWVPTEISKLALALLVAAAAGDLGGVVRRTAARFGAVRPVGEPGLSPVAAAGWPGGQPDRDGSMQGEAASASGLASVHDCSGGPSRFWRAPAPLLKVRDLWYAYADSAWPTLRGVNLQVRPGQIVQVRGPNGSGKSTLLKLIAGILPQPATGVIEIGDRDLTQSPQERSRLTAYVDQNVSRSVCGTLTVSENLYLAAMGGTARWWKLVNSRSRSFRGHMRAFGLGEEHESMTARLLSGGQRQALALVLLSVRAQQARLVLLDEPFNNLDSLNTERCTDLVQQLAADGCGVILVSHTLPHSLRPDHVVPLDRGAVHEGHEADAETPDHQLPAGRAELDRPRA